MQTIEKLSDRFWYMTPVSETDRPILGMVVGQEKSLLIDAGNSEAHAKSFLEGLFQRGVGNPNLVVLTHWHWDHIFGLSYFAKSRTLSISSIETKEEMKKLTSLSWSDEALDSRVKEGIEIEFCATAIKEEFPNHRDITITLPDLTFDRRIELDLGGVTCILQHVGGDHASDSVVVFIKEEKILFLGDSIYPDIFSAKRNYTIQKTIELLEKLEEFDAEIYVLSHWKPITKEEFTSEANLLKTIAAFTDRFMGDLQTITEEYVKLVQRELNEDELETIEYFVNGYQMQSEKKL